MTNFAERIAYWYLRLNGFFLVENFVHHHRTGRPGADCDLLGVRLRDAREFIGGTPVGVDDWNRFGFALDAQHVALIVQVKCGGRDAANAFSEDRLVEGVLRLGAFDQTAAERVARTLLDSADVVENGWRIAKLIIGTDGIDGAHFLLLDHAWAFVCARFELFRDIKRTDWDHLPDPIVQLLAWDTHRKARLEEQRGARR